MAITVRKLFKNATILYQMKLIGGKEGLDHLVQWVHIIEDEDVSQFLHGQELVFTSGILNREDGWLLSFAKALYEAGTSAFVVNIGPYTKSIPQEVIAYCDEVKFPLFTIPWETRMVDMTRDFCHRIMKNDDLEMSMSTLIKNIIFGIGDMETQILQMARYGYEKESRFCFIAIEQQVFNEWEQSLLKRCAERIARSMHEFYIAFSYQQNLVLVLVEYSVFDIEAFINRYLKLLEDEGLRKKIHMGVSSNNKNIIKQREHFNNALEAVEMAKRKNEEVIYYEQLGIHKILLSVKDQGILNEFYEDTIGKLVHFDEENQTELTAFLKVYLENNGSPQIVSEKQYIHRNTVTNQLKKIKKITGYDPMDLEEKMKLFLGFYIQDLL